MYCIDLSGKRALVTGASRGAGVGFAKALAKAGASVVLTARSREGLERTKAIVEAEGGVVDGIFPADLSTRASCRELARQVGDVDILVNNAALTTAEFANILTHNDDYWDQEINMNLIAPLTLMQSFCPYMARKKRGTVINISSIAAQRGTPGHAAYAASKIAMDTMSKVAAIDLAKDGINVVVVAFGMVETEALQEACADGITTQDIADRFVPIGRTIDVMETGALCVYLCSDEARPLTGIVINIDGGVTAGNYSMIGSFGIGVQGVK